MTDFVRVRLDSGAEVSMSVERAELLNLKPLEKSGPPSSRAFPVKYDPLKKKPAKAADTSEKENAS